MAEIPATTRAPTHGASPASTGGATTRASRQAQTTSLDWLWRLYVRLAAAADQSLRYAYPKLSTIAALASVLFVAYYAVWKLMQPDTYENLTLRIIGSLVALPVALHQRWPARFRRHLAAYWIGALTYCLPFFFTYMLLQDANGAYLQNTNSTVWAMSALAAFTLLIMLIADGLLIGIMFIVGAAAAWALFLLTVDTVSWTGIRVGYLPHVPVFAFVLVVGTIYSRHRETLQQEKLGAVASVGNNIAHELRTPLLGIRATAQGLRNYLPALVQAHEAAVRAGLDVPAIRRRHIELLRDALDRIESETHYSNTIIDMLLINSGTNQISSGEFRAQSARDCVLQAIARYPFASESERARVHVEGENDFSFRGSDLLLIHVLFNLLKNALYFIASAGKGEIRIWFESDDAGRRLYFMDTGSGIHPSVLPRIFERFYTSHQAGRGSGIGLSFCKSVMESFGGTIRCESRHGEYTRFILAFGGPSERT